VAPLGYIEILDGKGNVIERHGLESFPVSVGRAYTNQVIVGDPYVCPLHLTIAPDEQGRLIARDLDSVNGLRASAEGDRVATLEIHSGSHFRIGHTSLRYCSVDHPLAPTAVDRLELVSRLTSPYAAVAAGVLVLVALCLESFLSSIERVKAINIISEPLPIIATMLGWAGLWSLASRIVVSHFNFAPHVTIACAALLATSLLGVWSEWLEFFLPAIPILWLAGLLGYGVILAGLVFGHLGFASYLRSRSRLWAALAVSIAVIGMNTISYFAARSRFSTVMEYTGVLKPIDASLLPATSVDQFVAGSLKIRSDLEGLALKAKASQP
jgi:pSer/pThr/pTyr-binding forkhead associated (FHA) protein